MSDQLELCLKPALDEHAFEQYRAHATAGRFTEARAAALRFVRSVPSVAESRACVYRNLPRMPQDQQGRMCHEIFVSVVFPVLREDYHADQATAKYWLAMTHGNLLSAPECHIQIARAGPKRLLQSAIAQDGRNRAYAQALLAHLMSVFDYMDRDWPREIRSGPFAMTEGWSMLARDIDLARRLDRQRMHQDRLDEFADRVAAYQARGRALARKENLLGC